MVQHVYLINYLINRQVEKKGGKLVAMFVDLRAAFDSVDREVLIETMRETRVREGITRRVKQIIREMKSRVKIGGEIGESFWTENLTLKRQGCSLSPTLFNILMADLEEQMGKVK